MEEQKTVSDNWRDDVTEVKDILKIKDGESVEVVFADEGAKQTHADFGNSICFGVMTEDSKEPKRFYVKANNFNLLAQIKSLGEKLTGMKCKISRKGSKRSDTRYKVEKI
jgi:hypothetical protein